MAGFCHGASRGAPPRDSLPCLSGPYSGRLRRMLPVVLCTTSLLFGVLGLGLSISEPDLDSHRLDITRGVVAEVERDGLAWRTGFRPGQTIVEIISSDDPSGWATVVGSGDHHIRLGETYATVSHRI